VPVFHFLLFYIFSSSSTSSEDDDFSTPLPPKLIYPSDRPVGTGSFGVVVKAILQDTHEEVAIKKVLHDRNYKVFFYSNFSVSHSFTLSRTASFK
jgi:serine/threonine protein kinase